MPTLKSPVLLLVTAICSFTFDNVNAADAFQDQVTPFLKTYCVRCHNPKTRKAELDLTQYTSAAMLGEHFRQWEHVIKFLKAEDMPPEDAKQPTAKERATIVATLEQVMLSEATKLAGDPGVVLPRRLTGAEYDYTIRDLTGIDIRPAGSFPVDPASGEGFNNTGEALTMSPSLFKKYYAAAQHIADHVLFTPTGMRFAPHPVTTYADQKKFYEQEIIRFYEQHNVDYETYLKATWAYRYRVKSQRTLTVEQWAKANGLSPKYLRSLWDTLIDAKEGQRFYLNWIAQRWNALPPPKNAEEPIASDEVNQKIRELAAYIRRLSVKLCPQETRAIVSNAGNGPVQHIDRRTQTAAARDTFNEGFISGTRRLQLEFKQVAEKPFIKIFFQVSDVVEGEKREFAIFKDLNLSTSPKQNYRPNDDKNNISLQAILAEHAPDQLKRLQLGVHPLGHKIGADEIALPTSTLLEITVPSKTLKGWKNTFFYADARLDRQKSKQGIARVALRNQAPSDKDFVESAELLIDPQHPIAAEFKSSCATLCRLFPNRFVYVDDTRGLSAGFHLVEGFFRDDVPLRKHVLSKDQNRQLNRLWDELYFGTGITEKMLRGFVFFERSERGFMKHADFDSIKEEDPELTKEASLLRFEKIYLKRSNVKATGAELDGHPIHVFFEDIRQGLRRRATHSTRAEPIYLRELLDFAERAYRRPLTKKERKTLQKFYTGIHRQEQFSVEQAVRAGIVSVLVSPHFCYRVDVPPPGETVKPLSDVAFASRLSFFLWSSMPDAELLELAKSGKLNNEEAIREQTQRMLKDPKVSGFALEFFGQWLRYRDFIEQESVNRGVFPSFDDELRQAMFEEPTRLATHLIQNDLPVTELLSGDETFVNRKLAQHYGLPFRGGENEWKKTNGMRQHGRGGLLGMAVFLTKNSQPQRTSPVKRGFWVVHKLLGEHIPAPPADVAVLPAKETDTNGKTIRELLAFHVENESCARCHRRFDPVGLSMEGFDPIGRSRNKDLAGRPVDNVVHLPNGEEAKGVPEFGRYLELQRKGDFIKTLCHKFLGYALGRSVELSDQALLSKMQTELAKNGYRFSTIFDIVVSSPQFRNQRCRNFSTARFRSESQGD
ncbi:MAG: DUF1592 domain-containing protein [Planctomycetaceae bacterium]|jgi:hypothetical protein|nr:DUF1592 domain-containing protein [Planctomycetaceae bacterium]MBT6484092.1 DUF1592 domain-containing protein [Planctomycetaceae bacterium]MBT6496403.1 DUF1592 domain-containing protein [Planctomycetaceae bacterium]